MTIIVSSKELSSLVPFWVSTSQKKMGVIGTSFVLELVLLRGENKFESHTHNKFQPRDFYMGVPPPGFYLFQLFRIMHTRIRYFGYNP